MAQNNTKISDFHILTKLGKFHFFFDNIYEIGTGAFSEVYKVLRKSD